MSAVTAAPETVVAPRPSLLARAVIAGIRGYQYAFSWTRPSCRFWPTCSQYTLLAVRRHGAWRGLVLGARRIGRCHPWNPGGHDPVPGVESPNVCSEPADEPAGAQGKGRNT